MSRNIALKSLVQHFSRWCIELGLPDQLSGLMLDFQVAKAKKSMLHSEVALARWVTQEGRGLVVVVNKMDLLKGKEQAELRNKVMKAVPEEVNNILPQVWFNEVHLDMIDTFLRSTRLLNFGIFGMCMVLVCLVLQYVHCSAMNLIMMQSQVHHN